MLVERGGYPILAPKVGIWTAILTGETRVIPTLLAPCWNRLGLKEGEADRHAGGGNV